MGSFAEERFRFQARVARVFVCFFVRRSWHGDFEDYEVEFGTWYAAWVVLTTVVALTYEAAVFIHRLLSLRTNVPSFFDKLYNLLHFLLAIKVIVNFLVLNFNTPTIVAALKAVKRLELAIRFRIQDDKHFWIKERVRISVFTLSLLAVALSRAFAMREVTEELSGTTAFFITALSMVLNLYYGVISAMVLLHVEYFCVMLSRYVKFQAEANKKIISSTALSTRGKDMAAAIYRLRTSFALLTKIVQQVDKCLRFAVLVNFICSAAFISVVMYALFVGETSWGKIALIAVYAIFTSMTIVDVSLSASEIREEAISLKSALESASVLALPSRLCRQVELFALSIDKDQFCFTASGFFTVDKSTLTSFVAAVMTYSLLLVETGRKYEGPDCGLQR